MSNNTSTHRPRSNNSNIAHEEINNPPSAPVNYSLIMKAAKACEKLQQQLQDMYIALLTEEYWSDCTRLIERTNVFVPFIKRISNNDPMIMNMFQMYPKKSNELSYLLETLELIKSFIINFRDRLSFQGITEASNRDLYSNDIAKLNQRLMRVCEGFNLQDSQKESNYIQRRKEDLKDAKTSFKAAVMKVLEEITNVRDDPNHYHFREEDFRQLTEDVLHYPEGLSYFLSLMKHHPLSVYEARALKLELNKLIALIEIRKEEFHKNCELKKLLAPPRPPPRPTGLSAPSPDPTSASSAAAIAPRGSSVDSPASSTGDDPFSLFNAQNQKNKVLEQYRLSPADIKRTRVSIDYGNFGQIYLGLYQGKTKITVRKIPRKEENNQYLAERLLLMHHLNSSHNVSTNGGGGGTLGGGGALHSSSTTHKGGVGSSVTGSVVNAIQQSFIQPFYGFITSEHSYQLIEEWSTNGILEGVLADNQNFPYFQMNLRMAWVYDLISGIEFLHSKGIVHSEITPGNILISDGLRLKIGNIHATSDILSRYRDSPEKLKEVYRLFLHSPYIAPELKQMIELHHLPRTEALISKREAETTTSTTKGGVIVEKQTTVSRAELMKELPSLLEFTQENDIYSFMVTCFAIVFRRTPAVNQEEMAELFEEAMEMIQFHSDEARLLYYQMMSGMLEYKPIIYEVSEIIMVKRPKAIELVKQIHEIVQELGGDPRIAEEEEKELRQHHQAQLEGEEDGAPLSYLGELEAKMTNLQNERAKCTGFDDLMKKISLRLSGPETLFINQAIAATANSATGLTHPHPQRSSKNLSKGRKGKNNSNNNNNQEQANNNASSKVSVGGASNSSNASHSESADLSSLTHSATESKKSVPKMMTNPLAATTTTTATAAIPVRQPKASLQTLEQAAAIKADQISKLTAFFYDECHCVADMAQFYAETLVNSQSIFSVTDLARRIEEEEPGYLLRIGFEMNDALEVGEAIEKYPAAAGGVPPHDGEEEEDEEMRMFLAAGGLGGGEVEDPHQMLSHYDASDPLMMIMQPPQLQPQMAMPMQQQSRSMISQYSAAQRSTYSQQQQPQLSRYQQRVQAQAQGIFSSEGEIEDERFTHATSGYGGGGSGSTIHSNYSNRFSFLKENRLSRSTWEIPSKLLLPTDVANLYEKAILQNDENAYLELVALANSGDQFARGFLMRYYALGQGNTKPDFAAAQRYGEGLFSWLEVVVQSENAFAVMVALFLLGVCYGEGVGSTRIVRDEREAFRWFKLSAEKGYAMAQSYLGYCYYTGKGCPQNYHEAVKWYTLAADQGHAGAQSNLGLCYENGHGVAKASTFEAVRWYKMAAEQKYGVASYNLAVCYERGAGVPNKDYAKAFQFYLLAIQQSYWKAEYRIGLLFENNLISIQDEEIISIKASHYTLPSSFFAGINKANNNGSLLQPFGNNNTVMTGYNTNNNVSTYSINNNRNVLNGNNGYSNNMTVRSEANMSMASRKSMSRYSQQIQAQQLQQQQQHQQFPFSSTDETDTSMHSIEELFRAHNAGNNNNNHNNNNNNTSIYLSPPNNNNNLSTYSAATKKSQFTSTAAKNNNNSNNNNDSIYSPANMPKGKDIHHNAAKFNTRTNSHEAFFWYLSAALRGLREAQIKVGQFYEAGIATNVDAKKAFHYYSLAATPPPPSSSYSPNEAVPTSPHISLAKFHLAACYSIGIGVEPDLEKALFYYEQSAKEGNTLAQNNLAYFYYKGYGVNKDLEEAKKWYMKAIEKGFAPAKYNLAFLYEKNGNTVQITPVSSSSSSSNQNMMASNGRTTSMQNKPTVKFQEIMNLYLAAANGGVGRAKAALHRLKS